MNKLFLDTHLHIWAAQKDCEKSPRKSPIFVVSLIALKRNRTKNSSQITSREKMLSKN